MAGATWYVVRTLVTLFGKSDLGPRSPAFLDGDGQDLVPDAGCVTILIHYLEASMIALICGYQARIVNLNFCISKLTFSCNDIYIFTVCTYLFQLFSNLRKKKQSKAQTTLFVYYTNKAFMSDHVKTNYLKHDYDSTGSIYKSSQHRVEWFIPYERSSSFLCTHDKPPPKKERGLVQWVCLASWHHVQPAHQTPCWGHRPLGHKILQWQEMQHPM